MADTRYNSGFELTDYDGQVELPENTQLILAELVLTDVDGELIIPESSQIIFV